MYALFESIGAVSTLALRNLLRNKRRTLLTLLSLVIGLWGVLLIDGFVTYSMWGLGETVIHSGTGHLQIAGGEGFFNEGSADPFSYLLPDSDRLIQTLRANPEVRSVFPSLSFQAVLRRDSVSQTVQAVALPPEAFTAALDFRSIVQGRDIRPGDAGAVVLGVGLAAKVGARVGDPLHLMSAMAGGGVNLIDLELVGVSSSGIAAYDAAVAYLPLETARSLLLVTDVPQLLVFLERTEDTEAVRRELADEVLPLSGGRAAIRTWSELSEYYRQASGAYGLILGVALAIILLVSAFIIANTVSMSVFERSREIGTLRTLGTTRGRLLAVFMAEGFYLGLLGSALGIALGLLSCQAINLAGGITFPAQPGMDNPLTMYFAPDLARIARYPLVTLPATLAGTLFPAARGVRISITEALRAV